MGELAIKRITSTNPQSIINSFLDVKEENSYNTKDNYKRSIDEFLDITLGKSIPDVTWEDLESLEFSDILQYKDRLVKLGMKNNTIKAKFSSVRALFKGYLCTQNQNININIFQLELPKEKESEIRKRSSGALTHEEVMGLISFAKDREYKGKTQALLFKTLYVTAMRHRAILHLTKEDLYRRKDITGKEVYTIEVYTKGKDIVKPISDDLYNELINNVEYGTNRVFNISEDTIKKTFSEFKDCYHIKDSRNIVIHSIKKASLDRVITLTGDMYKGAEQGDHKSIDTTRKYYVGKNKSLTEQTSYTLFNDLNREYNITDLEDVSKEDLLDIIQKAGNETLIKLIRIKEGG